ncbi:MAG: hypothetical protein WBG19_06670 [Thermoplasmata archaeon]
MSPNFQTGGEFGESVAISGSTMVVGAPGEADSGQSDAGNAYVFDAQTGKLTSKFRSPNAQSSGQFGSSVAISGSIIVVGAPGEVASGLNGSGHAYVFNATTGKLISALSSPNPQSGGEFGFSVAISGSNVAVGAPGELIQGNWANGNVYVFATTTGSLIFSISSPFERDPGYFGSSVSIGGNSIVIGEPEEGTAPASPTGASYVYSATDGAQTMAFIGAGDPGYFGASVATTGSLAAIGAPGCPISEGNCQSNGALVYDVASGAGVSSFSSPNQQDLGALGASISIAGSDVLVGAPGENGDAGNAYVFNATTGALLSTLTSPNPQGGGLWGQSDGEFGDSVAIGGTTVVVGAPGEQALGFTSAGHAYLWVTFKPVYGVAFADIGLVPGALWWVNITGQPPLNSTESTISTSLPNGTYTYTVASANKRYSGEGGSFYVHGTAVPVFVEFSRVTFRVTFEESGLPTKVMENRGWTVVLNGTRKHSRTSVLDFTEIPNGTYPVLITGPSGFEMTGSGLVTVKGATSVAVATTKGKTVTLSFAEKQLPRLGGTVQGWCVELDGAPLCSTKGQFRYLNLTPGNYSFDVVSPSKGQQISWKLGSSWTVGTEGFLTLVRSMSIVVKFLYDYTVTFYERGLSSSTWAVRIGGWSFETANGLAIQVYLPNGTYTYKIGAEPGQTSSGVPDKVQIDGANMSVTVNFRGAGLGP